MRALLSKHSLRRELRGCCSSHVQRDPVVPRCGRCIHGRPPAARRTHVFPMTTVGRLAAAKRYIHVRETNGARWARAPRCTAERTTRVQLYSPTLALTRKSVHARAAFSERRTPTFYGATKNSHTRIDHPRPPTVTGTLLSRQVTHVPHQAALSPPRQSTARAYYAESRRRKRVRINANLSLSFSLSFRPEPYLCMRDYA